MIVTLLCLGLLPYFVWSLLHGPRGFPYRDHLKADVVLMGDQLEDIHKNRLELDRYYGLMRPESIDPDLLDELARKELEMAAPNEIIIFDKKSAQ